MFSFEAWKEVPKWANYLATNEDGSQYWHENKPEWNGKKWENTSGGQEKFYGNRIFFVPCVEEKPVL